MKNLLKKIALSLVLMTSIASSSLNAHQLKRDIGDFTDITQIFLNYLSHSQHNIFSLGAGFDKVDDEKFKKLLLAEIENLDDIARLALDKLFDADFHEWRHINILGIDVLRASWKYTLAVRHHDSKKEKALAAAEWRNSAKKLGRALGKIADDKKIEKILEKITNKQIDLVRAFNVSSKHFSAERIIVLQNEIIEESIELAKHLVKGLS